MKRKGTGGKRREGRELGVPRWCEVGEIEKKFATFCNICNRDEKKRREPLQKGVGSGNIFRRYWKREIQTHPVPTH